MGAINLTRREASRVRNIGSFSRATRYRRRSPTVALWSFALTLSIGALVSLGYVVGSGPPGKGQNGFWDSLDRALTQPSVSLPLTFAILTCLAYAGRRVRFEWLAWRPGRIQVPDFGAPGLTSGSPVQLTRAFRDHLAGMRLASSGAAPAAQPQTDFLDVLGAAKATSSDVLGTLLGLLRAAVPAFTYEMRGVVVERAGPPRDYKVSVQIVRLPGEGDTIEVTDADLDDAIRRAADWATAAILPRTRLCKGPWVAWRRYAMPGPLFSAFENACAEETRRCYDQAYDLYYRALDRDPMNRMVRLQLGQLQEKRHMSLEALATYTAVVDTALPAGRNLPPGLYTRRAERVRTQALIIARYRRALLLAEGSFLKEWFEAVSERHIERAQRLAALRAQLTPWLGESVPAEHADALPLIRSGPKDRELSADELKRLHGALAACAIEEVRRLTRDLPLAWRLRRRPPLTRRALELTHRCIKQRAALADALGDGSPRHTPVAELNKQIDDLERWRFVQPRRPLRRWEEHYNAACLYAIPLLEEPTGLTDQAADAYTKRLASLAVARLERAAACADSSFIARQRDWITSEDPDLDGLRRQPRFNAFESAYFPADAPTPRRPKDVEELSELRCTRELLANAARGWEAAWHARASTAPESEGEDPVHWWTDEHEVWRHVHGVALHHNRRARLALAEASRKWHLSYGIDAVEPIFGLYEQSVLEAGDEAVDEAAAHEIRMIHERLSELSRKLSMPDEEHSFEDLAPGFSELDIFDAGATLFTPAMRSRLCARQARVWRRLNDWLLAPQGTAEQKLHALEKELARAQCLWRRTRVTVAVRRASSLWLRLR
jgi:hypothetical protein